MNKKVNGFSNCLQIHSATLHYVATLGGHFPFNISFIHYVKKHAELKGGHLTDEAKTFKH